MKKIKVGLAGCGFVSELHMHAYKRVYGVDVEVSGGRGAGRACGRFCATPPDSPDLPQLSD